jgi:uncharacterized membrane protein YccC
MLTKWVDIERLIHSTKTAIACLIGFFIVRLIGFPADQWVLISIIVVMCAQIYVGSVLQKSYLRFLGTLVGCLFATFMLVLFGHTDLVIAITIVIAAFIFSYIATGREDLTYTGTLGAVTAIIIMLTKDATVTIAGERFLEISVGIFIATVVSQFVLPIHASTHLRRTQKKTLEQLRDYYHACMVAQKNETDSALQENLEENILKSRAKQRTLAKEAAREPFGKAAFDPKRFIQTLNCEKEILRAIDFMHQALMKARRADHHFANLIPIQAFNTTTLAALDALIKAIETGKSPTPILLPDVNKVADTVREHLSHLDANSLTYVDGFIFSAEMLLDNLNKLAKLHRMEVIQQISA